MLVATLFSFVALLPTLQERPTPELLIEGGRTLLPAYDGDLCALLTGAQQKEAEAASHLFHAALDLSPDHPLGLWWLAHAQTLLGENLRNRGESAGARTHFQVSLDALDRALELDPNSSWGWYARAMTKSVAGDPFGALDDLRRCVDLTNASLANATDETQKRDPLFLRYKARWWSAEVRMRVLDFETARAEFRTFYAENGNNRWDLGISLAESYLRERDFEGAASTYNELLAFENYGDYDGLYLGLGYLAGLQGDRERAAALLTKGLEREQVPAMYARLWMWILAPAGQHDAAEEDLRAFLANPPTGFAPWDQQLGDFVLGAGSIEEFQEAARTEELRRKREALPLDDLMCEVWFYVGLRLEFEGQTAKALAAYRSCLAFAPIASKWEWEYARRNFAALAQSLGAKPDRVAFSFGAEAVTLLFHRPGETSHRSSIPNVLLPGDFLQIVQRDEHGERHVELQVVDAVLPD